MVVAHHRDDAAPGRRSGEVGMTKSVAGTVGAGPFAVPDAEHAIVAAIAAQLGLLGAPQRGCRKILVDAGLEQDVGGLQRLAGAPELGVEAAERRAAIATDIAGGVLA